LFIELDLKEMKFFQIARLSKLRKIKNSKYSRYRSGQVLGGDFEEFIDFQRIPLQGSGVRKLKINELRLS